MSLVRGASGVTLILLQPIWGMTYRFFSCSLKF